MLTKSNLQSKEGKKENWKLHGSGIFLGVVLVVVMQILSEVFKTPAYFGMSIMLLSVILVQLSYLVELKIKDQHEKGEKN